MTNKEFNEGTRYLVGTDIGGTFTDLVLLDRMTNRVYVEKILTDHADPSISISKGLDSLVSSAHLSTEDIDEIIHATTLATNALIEKLGAITALITTDGHTDAIDLRSGARYDLYDLNIQFHPPLVPRYLRRGIKERMLPSGKPLKRPEESEIVSTVQELIEKQHAQSVAICLLHSYSNPDHEQLMEKTIKENFSKLFVSTSNSIAPRISEHDRFNTTIVNAYVQPIVSKYVDNMVNSLSLRGFKGQLFIMTCDGGLVDTSTAKRFPVLLLESGPVAGAQISSYVARSAKFERVLGFDMGGTTAKGCAIKNGSPEKDYKFEAARMHRFKAGSGISLLVPTVKLIEIGGGGGSIAWIDSRGTLQVGPRSAGSNPGPVCYSLGGKEPTVTDADLALGYLSPTYFLGGKMKLDKGAALRSITKTIAEKFNVKVESAAGAIYDKVAEDIAAAFRLHAAERGADLRKFALTVFGGAGPVHGAHVAKRLGIKTVVSPLRAGVLSACGLLVVPPQFSLVQSVFVKLSRLNSKTYDGAFRPLIDRGIEFLSKTGLSRDQITISRKFDMRYIGQGFEIEVNDPYNGKFTDTRQLKEAFEERYEEVYLLRGVFEEIEIASFKVTLTGPTPEIDLFRTVDTGHNSKSHMLKGSRDCYFLSESSEPVPTLIYDRYALPIGYDIIGPAIVEEEESTCIIPPKVKAHTDVWNNLVLELE